jgi:hypothetical protein
MKLLYTLGNFVHAGHQILFYTINAQNENTEDYQKLAESTFAASFGPKNNMFDPPEGVDEVEPPAVGDVIWTHTSGNQYIATGIWRETPGGPIDFNALRLICKSVHRKAKELGQKYVSIPLITEDLDIWNFIYPIIEQAFPDVQVIVHIPTEEQIIRVLEHIGGEINAFQQSRPIIRFTQSSDD